MYSEKRTYIHLLFFALCNLHRKKAHGITMFWLSVVLAWLQPRIWNRRATPQKVEEQCGESNEMIPPKRPRSLPVALVAKCGAWFCAPLPKSALVFCSALGWKMVKARTPLVFWPSMKMANVGYFFSVVFLSFYRVIQTYEINLTLHFSSQMHVFLRGKCHIKLICLDFRSFDSKKFAKKNTRISRECGQLNLQFS